MYIYPPTSVLFHTCVHSSTLIHKPHSIITRIFFRLYWDWVSCMANSEPNPSHGLFFLKQSLLKEDSLSPQTACPDGPAVTKPARWLSSPITCVVRMESFLFVGRKNGTISAWRQQPDDRYTSLQIHFVEEGPHMGVRTMVFSPQLSALFVLFENSVACFMKVWTIVPGANNQLVFHRFAFMEDRHWVFFRGNRPQDKDLFPRGLYSSPSGDDLIMQGQSLLVWTCFHQPDRRFGVKKGHEMEHTPQTQEKEKEEDNVVETNESCTTIAVDYPLWTYPTAPGDSKSVEWKSAHVSDFRDKHQRWLVSCPLTRNLLTRETEPGSVHVRVHRRKENGCFQEIQSLFFFEPFFKDACICPLSGNLILANDESLDVWIRDPETETYEQLHHISRFFTFPMTIDPFFGILVMPRRDTLMFWKPTNAGFYVPWKKESISPPSRSSSVQGMIFYFKCQEMITWSKEDVCVWYYDKEI